MPKKNKSALQRNTNSVSQTENKIVASAHFSGPLPPPGILEGYKQIGILDNIMKLAMDANDRENRLIDIQEKNAEQQREITKTQAYVQKSSAITENIVYGCVCIVVLLIVTSIFALAFVLALKGEYLSAGVTSLISIGLPKLISLVYSTKRK